MSNRGARSRCRNTCAMPATRAPNGWVMGRAISMRTTIRDILWRRIISARTSGITSRPTKGWRRRSRSGSRSGGGHSPRADPAIRSPQRDSRQPRPCYENMQNAIREAKQALRNQVGAQLKRMEPGERVAASSHARALLTAQPLWKTAQWVLFYAPLPEELDVWPLVAEALSAGKKVALPRFIAENGTYEACQIQDVKLDLQLGYFGIREPAN